MKKDFDPLLTVITVFGCFGALIMFLWLMSLILNVLVFGDASCSTPYCGAGD